MSENYSDALTFAGTCFLCYVMGAVVWELTKYLIKKNRKR